MAKNAAEFEHLRCEDRGRIRIITVDRPKVLNALNSEVVTELSHAIQKLVDNSQILGVVLTGAGDKAFVAGADISEMAEMGESQALELASKGHAVGDMIAHLSVPVIAAVNGYALGGGCELALACDFIYASENAKFGQPEVKLGVIPGFGGTQRLIRRVGQARAMELCMTGEIISAQQAFDLGLVNRIVRSGSVLDQAIETLVGISNQGPLAVATLKKLMHEGAELPLSAANQLEMDAFAKLFSSEDQREGMQAFLAKRSPDFRGV